MGANKAILVVVDVQNGFVTDGSAHVVPIVVDLVRRWQAANGHVLFTRYHNYSGSPYEKFIGWRGLHEAPDTDLVDDLEPLAWSSNSHIIDKKIYSAFTDEGKRYFSDQGFTDLFICGIATDGCVLKTAVDAFEEGYTPWVLSDAVASNATRQPPEEVHRAGLMLVSRLIGESQVISSGRALSMLKEHPGA